VQTNKFLLRSPDFGCCVSSKNTSCEHLLLLCSDRNRTFQLGDLINLEDDGSEVLPTLIDQKVSFPSNSTIYYMLLPLHSWLGLSLLLRAGAVGLYTINLEFNFVLALQFSCLFCVPLAFLSRRQGQIHCKSELTHGASCFSLPTFSWNMRAVG
jgi:hypothetical protein